MCIIFKKNACKFNAILFWNLSYRNIYIFAKNVYMYQDVHYSIICTGKKIKTTKMAI